MAPSSTSPRSAGRLPPTAAPPGATRRGRRAGRGDPLLEPLRSPEIACDVEVTAPRPDGEPGRARLRCRQGLRGDRVASTAWAGGEVEVAAYGVEHWQTELARAAYVRLAAGAPSPRWRWSRCRSRRCSAPARPCAPGGPTCSTSSCGARQPGDPPPCASRWCGCTPRAAAGCWPPWPGVTAGRPGSAG